VGVEKGVGMVREYRLHGVCEVKYKGAKRGINQSRDMCVREEALHSMGSQMNWVPLLSAFVSSISKSVNALTRDWMVAGVASAYCEKSGTWSKWIPMGKGRLKKVK